MSHMANWKCAPGSVLGRHSLRRLLVATANAFCVELSVIIRIPSSTIDPQIPAENSRGASTDCRDTTGLDMVSTASLCMPLPLPSQSDLLPQGLILHPAPQNLNLKS